MNVLIKQDSKIFEKQEQRNLEDPFEGYFTRISEWQTDKDSLLDTPSAYQWLGIINWGIRNNLYSYQQPFQSKSGLKVTLNGNEYLMVSSYDYLGLIGHPLVEAAAASAIYKYGTGTGGVRLLTGSTELHKNFENELAEFKGTEASMTFTSGYIANIAIISSLLSPRDRVILDSKVHTSIVHACKLAHVPVLRFEHNSIESLEERLKSKPRGRKTLIVAEGIYSMDGDICPLPELIEMKKKYKSFLMIDEAHSFGVLGKNGRGVDEFFGVNTSDIDIWMGSLSKAIPSNGGFVAGAKDLIIYLQHGSAPFMFSAALNPASVAAARESLKILRMEPGRIKKLHQNSAYLRYQLNKLKFNTGNSVSPVIPVILGNDENAYRFAKALYEKGIFASAIVKPAVPKGSARLRLCATFKQDLEFLDLVIKGFEEIASSLKGRPPRKGDV